MIEHYCSYLAMIRASEHINVIQQRAPYLVKGVKGSVQSEILQNAYQDGALFFEVEEDEYNTIAQMPLNPLDRTQSFQNTYRQVFNEFLSMLGIYNALESPGNTRQIAGQTNANSHIIEAFGDIYLGARLQFTELFNLIFQEFMIPGNELLVTYSSRVAQTFQNFMEDPRDQSIRFSEQRARNQASFNTQNRHADYN